MSEASIDTEVTPVKVGDAVRIVTENYEERDGLVVAVHGVNWDADFKPLINVVYVSSDPAKHDPYGQQIERMSSVNHYNQTTLMPKRGRYWRNI